MDSDNDAMQMTQERNSSSGYLVRRTSVSLGRKATFNHKISCHDGYERTYTYANAMSHAKA